MPEPRAVVASLASDLSSLASGQSEQPGPSTSGDLPGGREIFVGIPMSPDSIGPDGLGCVRVCGAVWWWAHPISETLTVSMDTGTAIRVGMSVCGSCARDTPHVSNFTTDSSRDIPCNCFMSKVRWKVRRNRNLFNFVHSIFFRNNRIKVIQRCSQKAKR